MTWSIVARDEKTGHFGVAVSTCAFAVGARVPFIATGIGAIATQSFVNPYYGYRGLELLRAGAKAADVVHILTEGDGGRSQRQVHVQDRWATSPLTQAMAASNGADTQFTKPSPSPATCWQDRPLSMRRRAYLAPIKTCPSRSAC